MRRSIHKLAARELKDAGQWYEAREPGLGLAFLADFDATLARIVEHPESAPMIDKRRRRMLFTRFPYGIVYSLPGSRIRVVAVALLKRRPYYWTARR